METQTKQTTKKKSLTEILGIAKDAVLGGNWQTKECFDGPRFNVLLSLKKNDMYLRLKEAFQTQESKQTNRQELKEAMKDTPLWNDLEEYEKISNSSEKIYGSYLDKPVVAEFARKYQANPNYALKYLDKVLSTKYLCDIGSTHILGGDYYNRDYPWGNSRVIKSNKLIETDLAIIGARLAKTNGRSPDKFYAKAKDSLKEVSINLGGVCFHFGSKVPGLNEAAQLIKQREDILKTEMRETN